MNLRAEAMNRTLAEEVLNWKYTAPYDFYNNDLTDEEISELLNGTYFALLNEVKELAGFFCVGTSAQVPMGHRYNVYGESFVDMGLGMNPKLVGKGQGTAFGSFVLNYIEESHPGLPVRLTVASFNKRAIHLYEKLGFVRKSRFSTDRVEFITMIKNEENRKKAELVS
ncbi:GNAT family N-acetyltransferase [Planococcus sp. 1R117A]|uniref:GNAT family N-acetyltransferase n=1 Tax=Planococcus sp. 1R117A TaxID=3447020 RepID=UPI003EDBFB8E